MTLGNLYTRYKNHVGKLMSRGIFGQILPFLILAIIAVIISWTISHSLSKGFINLINTGSLRSVIYPPKGGTDIDISVGRLVVIYFIGTTVFSGLFIATITNIIRNYGDRYAHGTIRNAWSNHILYLGYDPLMTGTLRASLEEAAKRKTVIVVAVPDHVQEVRDAITASFGYRQRRRIYVMKTHRNSADGLRHANSSRAYKVFIVGQPDEPTHDAINLKSLGLLAGLCIRRGRFPKCQVYMRNRATMSLFGRQGLHYADLFDDASSVLIGKRYKREDVESQLREFVDNYFTPFNFYESIAGNLLCGISSATPPMILDWNGDNDNLITNPGRDINLFIVGMSDMGMALAREALLLAHYPKPTHIKITFCDDNALEQMNYFVSRCRELFNYCPYTFRSLDGKGGSVVHPAQHDILDVEFEFLQGSAALPEVTKELEQRAVDKNVMLTLAICTDDSPKNMAMALCLPRTLLDKGAAIPIWVYQHGDASLKPFMRHYMYGNVHTFSPAVYGNADLQDTLEYRWARWVNAVYRAYRKGNGNYEPSEEEILASWHQQTLSNCLSTIIFVRSFIIKMRSVGWRLELSGDNISLYNVNPHIPASMLNAAKEISNLADVEHTRWNIEKLLSGYKSTEEDDHVVINDELRDCRRRGLNEDHRELFKKQKENFEHDDIRAFSELEDYVKYKDVNMLESMVTVVNREINKRNNV